jgi:aspartate carbamoyltransferase catalytic subunit
VLILRHPLEGSARFAADLLTIPVINAGDGANQHPTQTLLDLYTICQYHDKIDGLEIGLVGDLRYGRTVHSLAHALLHYKVRLRLISPAMLRMPAHILRELDRADIPYTETERLDLRGLDVIYMTRIQRERFPDVEEYEKVRGIYVLDRKRVCQLGERTIVMHPLPRVGEIDPAVDVTPQARYFDQVRAGVPVRAALLSLVLGGS